MNPEPPPITFHPLVTMHKLGARVRFMLCSECAAVVEETNKDHHQRWHRAVTEDFFTGLAAAAIAAEQNIRKAS